MVVVMKQGTQQREIDKLVAQFQLQGLQVGITHGVDCTILGLVGDTTAIDIDKMQAIEDLKRDMQVLLAKSSCKQISREEVHALIDEIYEGYETIL